MRLPIVLALALTFPAFCLAEEMMAITPKPASVTADTSVDPGKQNEELKANLQDLQNSNNALSLELEHIKSLAADEMKLNEDNKKLLMQYETAKRENNTLNAENQSLKEQLKQNTFINGAIAVVLGMLSTLIIQYFARSKKRYSDWA